MNGTPRLPSSFPSTPGSGQRSPATSQNGPKVKSPLPSLPNTSTPAPSSAPLIPVNLVDAPSQRMYTLAVYGLLLVWRLYDWWKLVEEDTHSITLFVKWGFIDLVFLFGVPLLRIPWLEWSETTSFSAYFVHAVINGMLMFRIPLPIEGWLLFLTKTLFDREMSISENSVRPNSILHNSSLIMGKQIINILPEGSVTMNPDGLPFCIDDAHPSVAIPLRFNQTDPQLVQLLRLDFETNINETITLSHKELRYPTQEADGLTVFKYTAKKPGLYRLQKVVDRTKLEVQRRMSDTLVVACPKGTIKSTVSNKCLGDLSDLVMEIEGTAPLKVVYSRTANSEQSVHHFQSIQPENFASPLLGSTQAGTLVPAGSQDVSWARTQSINVPLNESMAPGGRWLYSIDEIHDATGNVANFSSGADDGEHNYPKGSRMEQDFTVHERPVARLTGCDSRNPLMVANGKSVQLPVQYMSPGRTPDETSHTLTWKFSPLDTLTKAGDHGDDAILEEYLAKTAHNTPTIRESGLYTLTSVKSKFCDGEIKEPASCLLINPPEPQLSITAENINDKCAGKPIGLLVDLDMIGTPPFTVRYDVITRSGSRSEYVKVKTSRHQLELKPIAAGHYKYHFTSIDDDVYKSQPLSGSAFILEQDVKPPAHASLRPPPGAIDACIEEPVEMNVDLSGEKPFTLEYEIVHDGKRKKHKATNIETDIFKITTDPLLYGGEYSLALTSVQDFTGCKIFLNSEVKFNVRRQRPKVSFGHLEGKHKTMEVEGRPVKLPLRLTGRPPWTIKYANIDDPRTSPVEKTAKSGNDFITVSQSGTYEILDVSDDQCPGTVDPKASRFEVDWLARPQIKVADTAVLIPDGKKWLKREVCEGDIDAVEVQLSGTSPYSVRYQVRHKPEHGSSSLINKEFEAALGQATISMDTSRAGLYEYKFSELSDALYDHDGKKYTPLVLEQKVNRKPSAHFVKPGQSYKYCKEEISGDEIIPIKLEGVPPFNLEVDIKHQSTSRPETVKIANIESNRYDFRIPHNVLSLGIHYVSVRKVRDSRGCQQKTEYGAPHVQVQVYDVPTIYPLESRTDYCVGERISYTLSGTAPFEIFYTFEGVQRKAKSPNTAFRRIAEKPGNFTITAVSDKASQCKAQTKISKLIHEMPSVKISKGRQVEVDIHEGGEAPILFEFWGTPPFEFTYTRSTNARKGQKSQVLETRHEVSYEHSKTIQSSQEGTYEVVAIKDKFCSFSTQKADTRSGQKLLQF
ncbi:Nucleoporin [Lachnellula arida]|uniref:Nucleoporin n=1 Tax=Lachnellula arida TaxID=1316785 RepID=A0A8T9BPD2_9HELO|nr:Nucleoporin [Lachnellula arida]